MIINLTMCKPYILFLVYFYWISFSSKQIVQVLGLTIIGVFVLTGNDPFMS